MNITTDDKRLPIGERVLISPQDERALYNLLGVGVLLIGKIDVTRGRVLDKWPGDWHLWNTEGKRIELHIYSTGMAIASCAHEIDPALPEPL